MNVTKYFLVLCKIRCCIWETHVLSVKYKCFSTSKINQKVILGSICCQCQQLYYTSHYSLTRTAPVKVRCSLIMQSWVTQLSCAKLVPTVTLRLQNHCWNFMAQYFFWWHLWKHENKREQRERRVRGRNIPTLSAEQTILNIKVWSIIFVTVAWVQKKKIR